MGRILRLSIGFFVANSLLLAFQPSFVSASKITSTQVVAAKDDDYVKSACRLWWNLPPTTGNSAKELQTWAKKVRPTVDKALSEAAKAKKANKKWSQFQLEMVTFWGSITLGEDIRYSKIMFASTVEKNAIKFLQNTCKSRR
jgi:hypothetical protein